MAITIVRVYETEQQAADAVRELEEAGFAAKAVLHVTPSTADPAEVTRARDMRDLGDFIDEQLAQERSVVAVRPPFGQARLATAILDEAGPLAVEVPAPKAQATRKSNATPLSDLFGLKVLTDQATPASDKADKRVLLNRAAPLSDKLGLPTRTRKTHFMTSNLSDNPAPFSSALGLRLLWNKAAPLSDKFGWATRSEKTHFMTAELSDDPTPLSSKLGLKVLTEKQ